MSKLTSGVLLSISSPLAYVTGITFNVLPLARSLEAYGYCTPVENFGGLGGDTSSQYAEICADGVRYVIDPIGLIIAIVFAAVFITGLVLIGLHIYQRRIFRKVIAGVTNLVIASALIYSVYVAVSYWLEYFSAKSSGCEEMHNFSNDCDPVSSLSVAIVFSLVSILLVIFIVVRMREEFKDKKTGNDSSPA